MNRSTRHWFQQRLSAVLLVVLVSWFTVVLLMGIPADYESARAWMTRPVNAGLILLLTLVIYWHAQLGLRVIAEDYVATGLTRRRLLFFVNLILGIAALMTVGAVVVLVNIQ